LNYNSLKNALFFIIERKITASETRPKGRASETAPPSCDVVVDGFNNCLSRGHNNMASRPNAGVCARVRHHATTSHDIKFASQSSENLQSMAN